MPLSSTATKPKLLLTGATGFVGQALAERLSHNFHVIGLSRQPPQNQSGENGIHEWRSGDLFSLKDAESMVQGCEYVVYLVHSMQPKVGLTQGHFEDIDWILADNLSRAAAKAGVRRIIYLGGLIPDIRPLSKHLQSRLDVENILGRYGVSVTSLRAGLIVGWDGSSFQMLWKLLWRLPVILCPPWTKSPTQPIAREDVLKAIHYCLLDEATNNQIFDIGGRDILTYRQMMNRLIRQMGWRRKLISVSSIPSALSAWAVHWITGAPISLCYPLVESLAYPMVAHNQRLFELMNHVPLNFEEALQACLASPRQADKSRLDTTRKINQPKVRSVQRLPLYHNAQKTAQLYIEWLSHIATFILRVITQPSGSFCIQIRGIKKNLLVLEYSPERSSEERALYYITGGWLLKQGTRGRFEFRETGDLNSVIAAIHDYQPKLPWFIYRITQAPLHLVVMGLFRRYLRKLNRQIP